ncbi:PTS transporter subunit EIIB [Arcanobacterium ihumii]|uniref:PTS transporter subunit EIIB n=1 Tax=Arcanobacterium ihumii TaxID=2138162 RepID=UPI0038992403
MIQGAETTEHITRDKIINLCGGSENIIKVDGAISRIELTVNDTSAVDVSRLRAEGILSVVIQRGRVQLIIGAQAQSLLNDLALELNTEPMDEY